jgi:flagellar hook protein FlgE
MHTCPTERPFYCITGELAGEGFLVVVDESTHELVVQEGVEAGAKSVIVNPKGVQVQGLRRERPEGEATRSGAIGAPRAQNRKVLSGDKD